MANGTLTGLTIAGLDPSSGAGITADLAVMASYGVFGTACATALTVQSTMGVKASHPVSAELIAETLAFLADDLPPAGVKIGMLGNTEVVLAIAEFLQGRCVPIVLDPVMRSSSGRELLEAGGVIALQERLLPMVNWITPNVEELAVLAGKSMVGRGEIEREAGRLRGRWPKLNIVVTGGDQDAPDDLVLTCDGRMEWLRGMKVESRATHGTGCAFSTALLCGLMLGQDGIEAVRAAKEFVTEGIRRATPRGKGKGPLNLFWPLRRGV
jgi:hydroxymethylpyrimidine/phosphomethylpyrimidine kinase